MFENALSKIGLNSNESKIYEYLLTYGEMPASKIAKKVNLSRTNAYMILDELYKKKIIKKITKTAVLKYQAEPPSKLSEMVSNQKKQVQEGEKYLQGIMPILNKNYNLSTQSPSVRFYEGEEALEAITADALAASSKIYSFVDIEAVVKHYSSVNKKFISQRQKFKKVKYVICENNEFNRKYTRKNASELTKFKLLKARLENFYINMQIYDNKISYISLLPKTIIGVIIEDAHIARLNKIIFEYIWGMGGSEKRKEVEE